MIKCGRFYDIRRTHRQGPDPLHHRPEQASGQVALGQQDPVLSKNPITPSDGLILRWTLHPACYVRLHSADLPGGRYGWLLYSSEIGGVQPRRDLEIVALHLQHEDALDEDTSETLLWLMAAQAETVPEARRHQEIDGEFIERAEDLFVSRLNARFSARRRSNEALVANRLASLRETYERNRELREQRVREARERRRQPTYIKGLETRTRTLDAGYHDKVSEIEATREMSRSYNLCAGGIVEIAHGTRSGGSGRRPVSR